MPTVCVIIPLYNEENYVLSTIYSLLKIKTIDEIIAIDDGSTDNTWNIIKNIHGINCIHHEKNLGKGQSIHDGFLNSIADIYLLVDGDLGDSAQNIEPLIDDVLCDKCDICIAKFPELNNSGGIGLLKYFAQLIVKYKTGSYFPCPLSGQRAIKREILLNKKIKFYTGFGIDVGMLIDIISCGYRVNYLELNLTHRVTYKNIKDYAHRIKQFFDILGILYRKY